MESFLGIFKHITENSNDSIILLNEKGVIQYCNPATEKLFLYNQEELIGKNFYEYLVDPKYFSENINHFQSIIKADLFSPGIFELKMKSKDDEFKHVEISPSLCLYQGQNYCTFFIRDITERMENERKTLEYQEVFYKIANFAHDAIIMIDNKGNVTYWNNSAERIFGYNFSEVYGKNVHELLAPEKYHAAHKEAFEKFKLTGKGDAIDKTLELTALKKDGSEFAVELSVSAFYHDDEWNSVALIRDISHRKGV